MNMMSYPQVSPQLGAVTGTTIAPDYEKYTEAYAERLPELAAEEYNRRMLQERINMERKAQEQASRDAAIGLGIEAVNTGVQLTPLVQKYGPKIMTALKPKPITVPTQTIPSYQAENPLALQNMPSYAGEGIQSAIPPVQQAGGVLGQATAPAQSTGFLQSGVNNFMEQSPIGKVGTVLGTTAGAYGAGQMMRGTKLDENLERIGLSKDAADVSSGALGGALTGFVSSGFNPLGAIAGAVFGGVGSKNKCVIVTAATSPDSDEVNIARKYRDKYMDRPTLRGYYMLAEWLVPVMESNDTVKQLVKEHLVDALIRYARWKLDYTFEHPSMSDCAIVRNFINYCRDLGSTVSKFVRQNGEEV